MKAVHTCMSFSNVKIRKFFQPRLSNMSEMRSWGVGGSTPLQEANRYMQLDGVAVTIMTYNGDAFSIDLLE